MPWKESLSEVLGSRIHRVLDLQTDGLQLGQLGCRGLREIGPGSLWSRNAALNRMHALTPGAGSWRQISAYGGSSLGCGVSSSSLSVIKHRTTAAGIVVAFTPICGQVAQFTGSLFRLDSCGVGSSRLIGQYVSVFNESNWRRIEIIGRPLAPTTLLRRLELSPMDHQCFISGPSIDWAVGVGSPPARC